MKKAAKESGKDERIVVRIRSKSEPTPEPLVSPADVRRFVTEFVSSWIRGDIVIRFPTATELSKKTPLSIAFPVDPSVNAELKIKEHYIDLLSTIAGIKKASKTEQEQAIADVFKMLLMFRSANRIEGKIISRDFERKVEEIEKDLNSQKKLLDQVTEFLFKPKKNKVKKPAQLKTKPGQDRLIRDSGM